MKNFCLLTLAMLLCGFTISRIAPHPSARMVRGAYVKTWTLEQWQAAHIVDTNFPAHFITERLSHGLLGGGAHEFLITNPRGTVIGPDDFARNQSTP